MIRCIKRILLFPSFILQKFPIIISFACKIGEGEFNESLREGIILEIISEVPQSEEINDNDLDYFVRRSPIEEHAGKFSRELKLLTSSYKE